MKFVHLEKQKHAETSTLLEEYRSARAFGELRLGTEHLFRRGLFSVKYIPLREIAHLFLRIESGESGEFPVQEHYIVVKTIQNREKEHLLRMERPEAAKRLLEKIKEECPQIEVGYRKNLKR